MTPALFKDFFPPAVSVFFTARTADFTLPEGAEGLSPTQKDYLSQKLGIADDKIFTIRQMHGNKILAITGRDLPQKGAVPQADGAVTNTPGIILSVRTADCLPIFLFDPGKKCIALVHAGWRGSSEKIVVQAITMMQEKYGSPSADLLVALGPSIRACCYEVSEEFKDVFPQEVSRHKGRFYLDLSLANKHQLMELGVKAGNIFDPQQCTVCDQQFFSYRRDKEKAGRHLSLFTINR